MQKHHQSREHDLPGGTMGDCFRVAVACVLERDPDDLPRFEEYENWPEVFTTWCRTENLVFREWHRRPGDQRPVLPECCALVACGKSPRGDWDHTVVWQRGGVVHDPHPSGDGLDGPPAWWLAIWERGEPMTNN